MGIESDGAMASQDFDCIGNGYMSLATRFGWRAWATRGLAAALGAAVLFVQSLGGVGF